MSLFKLFEWSTHFIPKSSCITNGVFFDNREQLVVGGEDGLITVLDPGGKEGDETSLFTYQSNYPCLQMVTGQFLPSMGPMLAVLSPFRLAFYRIVFDKEDEAKVNLEELYVHVLTEASYNMCVLTTQSVHILVQSVACNLSLFHGDQCIFSKSPLSSIHPGPVTFSLPSTSLITGNNGFLSSIKFSLLSSVSTSSKKITFDWSFDLGDVALELEIEDKPPAQPSVVVLCRRSVFCFTTGGIVRWQIRFEAVATAMALYHAPSNESARIRLVVATSEESLLVYSDERLVWNCHTHTVPVALRVSSYNKIYQNVITVLDADGKIIIGYPGTELNLYKVPADTRIVNYKEKAEQLRSLEAKIKEGSGMDGVHNTKFTFSLSCASLQKAAVEYNAKGPCCMLVAKFSGVGDTQKIYINLRSSFATPVRQIVFHSPRNGSELQIPFFVGATLPTSMTVNVAAHCFPTQASFTQEARLPFELLFAETSPDRNSRNKITIDTDSAVLPVNTIFPDFQTSNPLSIGFQVHAFDASVSIFAANKSNKYRVQSDNLTLLQVACTELMQRLRLNIENVTVGGKLPIEHIIQVVEDLAEVEKKSLQQKHNMESRMREVRAIEALILTKSKSTKVENLDAIDALFNKSHQQLLAAIEAYKLSQLNWEENVTKLGSLFELTSDLMRCQKVESLIDGNFFVNTQQKLLERLQWACKTERADEVTMIEILCQHAHKDLQLIVEEEEAD